MPATDALHTQSLVLDAHNDSLDRRRTRGDALDLAVPVPGCHVDLPRLRQGGVDALFAQCGLLDLSDALQLTQASWAMARNHPADFALALDAAAIRDARERGAIALVLQLESLTCLGGRLDLLETFYRLGVRIANLTHGEGPPHDCLAEPIPHGYSTFAEREQARRAQTGLSDLGRAAVREVNDLGMLLDLAHCNDAAFYQALELSATTPIFSHGSVFALCPHARALTDDQIRALAARGGVHGVACYADFIRQDITQATVPALVDLIEHSINLVGPDHVGIGADFDGLGEDGIAVPADVAGLPLLTDEMLRRGWPTAAIAGVLGANFMRVLHQVLD